MLNSNFEQIKSPKNQHLQLVRELLNKKTARDKSGLYLVEGVRLAEEAFFAGILPELVLFSEKLSPRGLDLIYKISETCRNVFLVPENILHDLSETETNQGLVMVMPRQPVKLPAPLDFVVVVDQLRDPGNLGTILRTAAAAGVQAVFVTHGSVDAYSPKVVRAGMGAHFRLPIISAAWNDILQRCRTNNPAMKIVLAESEKGIPLWNTNLKQPVAIVIGGEADGASDEVRAASEIYLNIPMPGGSESLNAAVASSIILFEVVRQRNQ